MNSPETLEEIGEHAAIAALTANLNAVGDDCAVLPLSQTHDLVLTSDPLIQNIHFTHEATPQQIANKAAGRVFSDFAAMGAEPQYLLINIVAPPEQKLQTLEKIYAELSILCKKHKVEIVGGDLAQGPTLELHVFGTGRVEKGTAILRSGANPGDLIYVTGPLGGAQKTGKHLTFEPRLEWGNALRESGTVTSMMDISDGLATDLRHILKASNVGAELDLKKLSLIGDPKEALFDGEDFELLFTAPPGAVFQDLKKNFPIIGKVTANSLELSLEGTSLEGNAFEHFKSQKT